MAIDGSTVWLVVSNDLDVWESSVHVTREGALRFVAANMDSDRWEADDSTDEWTDGCTTVWVKEMRVLE